MAATSWKAVPPPTLLLGLGTMLPEATLQTVVRGIAAAMPGPLTLLGLAARPMAPPVGLAEAALAVSAAVSNKNNNASGHIENTGCRRSWVLVCSLNMDFLLGCLPKSCPREAL